jgi:hypothetical protein
MIQPISTDKSVAWTTDRGHLYVGHGDKAGVRYRLEANDTIAARATYKGLRESSWRRSTATCTACTS